MPEDTMIYLDNAATSFPKPEAVYKRVDYILRNISGNPGRASHRMALEAGRIIFNARELVARLIGAPDSSRVVFTKNATEAINVALKGFLRPGDHAVTTTFEHNSVAKTLARLERDGVEVTKIGPDGDGFLDPGRIEKAIRGNTRLVAVVHASNVFGAVQDAGAIGDLCRRRGVRFMADGAQTVGALPVDVDRMNIDILAGTGHKSLFGPQGTGFLYLREGIEPDQLISGGTGDLDNVLEIPERLESGTLNTPGIGGLAAGVEFVLSEGIERIRAREEALLGRLISGLREIPGVGIIGPEGPSKRACLVAFNIEGVSAAEAGMRLDSDYSIMVRSGAHCAPEAHKQAGTYPNGAVRVSPGYFTADADIERLLEAIREIAKR